MLKPIPNFPDYFASEEGEIYSTKPINWRSESPQKPRKLSPSTCGRYAIVTLYRNGTKTYNHVSRLILLTFVGEPPKGFQVCHGILGKKNNSLKNLSWGSRHKNCYDDKIRDGTILRGEKHPLVKLNELQVRIIRRAYVRNYGGGKTIYERFGLDSHELAEVFGVVPSCILSIVKRKVWKHINQV